MVCQLFKRVSEEKERKQQQYMYMYKCMQLPCQTATKISQTKAEGELEDKETHPCKSISTNIVLSRQGTNESVKLKEPSHQSMVFNTERQPLSKINLLLATSWFQKFSLIVILVHVNVPLVYIVGVHVDMTTLKWMYK